MILGLGQEKQDESEILCAAEDERCAQNKNGASQRTPDPTRRSAHGPMLEQFEQQRK